VKGRQSRSRSKRVSWFEWREIRLTTALKLILAIFVDSIYLDNNPSEIPATDVVDG